MSDGVRSRRVLACGSITALAAACLLVAAAATTARAGERSSSQSRQESGESRATQQIVAPAAAATFTPAAQQSNDSKSSERSSGSSNSDSSDKSATQTGFAPSSSDSASSASSSVGSRSDQQGSGGTQRRSDDQPQILGGQKIPGTVAEWLQQMFDPKKPQDAGNKQPSEKGDIHRVGETPKPSEKTGEKRPELKPAAPAATSRTRTTAAPIVPLPAGTPEVLALNMSPKGLQRALSLGFKANGNSSLGALGFGITRLLAPPGMGAADARELLKQALPDQGIEVNMTYRIYHVATGEQPKPANVRPADMNTPCGTDRCLGASLIKWQPQLDSCARDVKIGLIDTDVDQTHLALGHRAVTPLAQDLPTAHANRIRTANWHGTGVMALLAGGRSTVAPGLVPDAKYFLADIFYGDAKGLPVSDTASLLEALDWLGKKNVNIINMSLAGPHDDLLKTAISKLSRKGILFVAAVGNDGPNAPPAYPSAYPEVIAVTAVTKDLASYRYAGRGNHVDLAAPGVGIWTAMPDGSGAYHSGTSFAVPFATAVIAAIYKGLPEKTKDEALKRLNYTDLGPPGRDPIYGRGLVMAPSSCDPMSHSPAFVTTVSAVVDNRK